MRQIYNEEEAQAILRTALQTADETRGLSRDELLRSAAEAGLDESQIARAEATIAASKSRERVVRENRSTLVLHSGIYAIVILALFGIGLMATPGEYWALIPALGWGIGLAIHALWFLTYGRNPDGTDSPDA